MSFVLLRKRMSGVLEPVDDAGQDALRKIAVGDVVRAEIKRPRNLAHHKKWWSLVSLIYQNQTHYQSPEELDDAIKVYIGHCSVMVLKDGTEVRVPKSIAFSAMDQTAFEEFYERALNMICEKIIPRLNQEDLKRELLEYAA